MIALLLPVLLIGGLWYFRNDISGGSETIGCTLEAKICPDGSAVGRTGANCEFAACPVSASSTFGNPQVEKAITDYLLTERHFSWKNQTESYNFCAIENLEPDNQLFPLSVWVFCAEYAEVGGELKEVGGSSLPAKINYPNELSFYDQRKFTYDAPRDGSYYTPDIKEIFSKEAQDRIFEHNATSLTEGLFRKAKANLTSWNTIKSALANCEVKSLFQNHQNEVAVKLKNGTEISAIEPRIDLIMDLATASGCPRIQMATE